MLVEFLDVLVSALELLYQLRVLRLEELSFPVVAGVAVVEILLFLKAQPLPAPVLVTVAEQPHDVSVGNIGALLLSPGGGQLVEDDPAVDGETPGEQRLI